MLTGLKYLRKLTFIANYDFIPDKQFCKVLNSFQMLESLRINKTSHLEEFIMKIKIKKVYQEKYPKMVNLKISLIE